MSLPPLEFNAPRNFRFSLSIGWFHTDLPLLQRFDKAAADGFTAVEMFWPQNSPKDLLRAKDDSGLDIALINMYEGEYASGDRGFATAPDRIYQWREKFREALDLACTLGCHSINVLTGDVLPPTTHEEATQCCVENLAWAAKEAQTVKMNIVVEPLNHLTHPTYLCQRSHDVLELIAQIDQPNILLQYDVYHAQCSEGNLIETVRSSISKIGHIQLADVPSRSAPGTGEINFTALLNEINELGYRRFIGLEYNPDYVSDPLAWLPRTERGQNHLA